MRKGKKEETESKKVSDENRDPVSGAKGSHPVGTAAGAASGAAAGAAVGTVVGGPVGMAVGGVTGAIAGGLAGKGVAEAVNPTVEDAYWRENHGSRPYASGKNYDALRPAYRYGWESRSRHLGKEWKEVEKDLGTGWDEARGESKLAWDDARAATHDAWTHSTSDSPRQEGGVRDAATVKPAGD